MLDKDVFDFLNLLKRNNNREWFKQNKELHDQSKKKVLEFSQKLFEELKVENNLDKSKVFRIYRDVRFSKNKTPYKNHFGIGFHRTKPQYRGGYYLHIEPENSFLATGFWAPDKTDLYRIRKEIEQDHQYFSNIAESNQLIKSWNSMLGEQLKTAPKGFDKNHPGIQYLRYKQFIFSQKISNEQLQNPSFSQWIIKEFSIIKPFLNYMGEVLTTDLNGEPLF
ncbi:MAG: DUF2461 domain-containing protein [Parvicellaceae bacterium]